MKWKKAPLITIFKKSNKMVCGNYHSFSLLLTPGKAFPRVLLNRLSGVAKNLLPDDQCGFREESQTWSFLSSKYRKNALSKICHCSWCLLTLLKISTQWTAHCFSQCSSKLAVWRHRFLSKVIYRMHLESTTMSTRAVYTLLDISISSPSACTHWFKQRSMDTKLTRCQSF